jgi:ABC-type phosphate transport system permease subunit
VVVRTTENMPVTRSHSLRSGGGLGTPQWKMIPMVTRRRPRGRNHGILLAIARIQAKCAAVHALNNQFDNQPPRRCRICRWLFSSSHEPVQRLAELARAGAFITLTVLVLNIVARLSADNGAK